MKPKQQPIRLTLLGFGHVGRALARLLMDKEEHLRQAYDLTFQVVGIATGSHGMALDPAGIDLVQALSLYESGQSLNALSRQEIQNSEEFIRSSDAHVLFETIPVNYDTGQPALGYLKRALQSGMHGITANKGPVVHGYHELKALARQQGRSFLFESAVMDGAPVFSLARCGLPAAEITGFRGILNSTTNFILSQMEEGHTLEAAITQAQGLGIAETDPSGDVDGWDAAIKVAALATVLMDIPLTPQEVMREGIRSIDQAAIEKARMEGTRWKLVCSARRSGQPGRDVRASVGPQMVSPSSPLYHVTGTSAILQIESDVLGELSLQGKDPTPMTTAYGLLADFMNAIH